MNALPRITDGFIYVNVLGQRVAYENTIEGEALDPKPPRYPNAVSFFLTQKVANCVSSCEINARCMTLHETLYRKRSISFRDR